MNYTYHSNLFLKVKRLMSEHTPPPSQPEGADGAARRLNVSGGGGEEDEEHWLVSTSTRSRESTPGKSLRLVGGSVLIEIPEYEKLWR